MHAFNVPGKMTPRHARDEAGEDDVGEGSGDSPPGARRQHWSDEEKVWIVQESFERGTTVEEVAERHGVTHRRLLFWRKQFRRAELVVLPAPQSEGPFAGVETGAPATGTIVDDDTATVTLSAARAEEGETLTFTATLDKAVSGGLTATPSYADGTATKGSDYTENTVSLTFEGIAGETVALTVSTVEDAAIEEDETFTVVLAVTDTLPGVTGSRALGTIANDD